MDVQTVAEFFQQLNKTNLNTLSHLYHPDIVFEDAAHRIHGLAALEQYFQQLYQHVSHCCFVIHERHPSDNGGFLVWTMTVVHPKLNGGHPVAVNGVSQVKFAEDKVIYHRDYFDLGEMIYEHLPILGRVIRTIKQRLGR